jgi:putative flippase GtrA
VIKHFLSQQFALFLLTGGIAAAVNFGSRIIYSQRFDFSVAVVLAYCTGMLVAFVLAKLFVFKRTINSAAQSVAAFVFVNVLGAAQTWLISILLAFYVLPALNFTWRLEEVAHFFGVLFPVFTSYLGHKHWSFR